MTFTHSRYAQNVIERGDEVVGRELDRLQAKLAEVRLAIARGSTDGLIEARKIMSID